MLATGVRLYLLQPGFTHKKVVLVDIHLTTVGMVNWAQRTFHPKFEITVLVYDCAFA